MRRQERKIPIPELDGEYVSVYRPRGDVYRGENTPGFRQGHFYREWIVNDFSILQDGETWHMVGITHPRPDSFIHDFDYDDTDVHEGEFQLFHSVAEGGSFRDIFRKDSFTDCGKILYPSERPGERKEIWAPHLMKVQDRFQIIYSPGQMRRMSSDDFRNWQKEDTMFVSSCEDARDPYLYEEGGRYYCIYTEAGILKYRTSRDLHVWSEEAILQDRLFGYGNVQNESPFLLKREGIYYLFWSIFDGRNGCYDNRTMVFAGSSFGELRNSAPLTMLRGHAPEIVSDQKGEFYFLSAFYPCNGISAVKLKWV